MEYLEDNEEARMMAAEMFVDGNLAGDIVDPEGEQEQEDNQQDLIRQQEEFDHADLEFVEQPADDAFKSPTGPSRFALWKCCGKRRVAWTSTSGKCSRLR